VTTLSTTFRRVFNFWVSVTLLKVLECELRVRRCNTNLISVSKPRGAFFLTTNQGHPLTATSTETLPNIWVSVHASSLLWLREGTSCCSTYSMGETLIVPECAVLEYQPASWFANSTPSFPLISVSSDPARCVQVPVES